MGSSKVAIVAIIAGLVDGLCVCVGELSVELFDSEGVGRTRLSVLQAGRPAIRLIDGDKQVRGEFSLGAEGEPGIGLSDRDGKGGMWVYVALNGSRGVGLLDHNGEVRAEMSLQSGGRAILAPFDKDCQGK